MLGRLIQTAANYGRGSNTLESATEESHTRNLLYGQTHHIYSLAQSPPTSPYATPVFRPGSFDDRGGLELEEKDVRILIAQDAGVEEKPTLLFDSRPPSAPTSPLTSHVRHASLTGPRSPLPNDWKSQAQHASTIPTESVFRGRSSTMTGPAPWNRPKRDMSTREEAFLECMFGVANGTKVPSTTKMHILPGKPKSNIKQDMQGKATVESSDQPPRRIPLHRSRTSNTIVKPQHHHTASATDSEAQSHDSVLITRLFSVALSETVAPSPRPADGSASPATDLAEDGSPTAPTNIVTAQMAKKPKLVERKVPAFAIGLVINLPRTSDSQAMFAHARPVSRSAHAHTHALSSASSSYGSDMQGSWSFLNAIPESLASTATSSEEPDKRIETIVGNEDVILRAIALIESESTRVIYEELQKVLNQVVGPGPGPKTPKEKSMQRINQRIISISNAAAIFQAQSLQAAAKLVARRVIYALRIPRVTVGLGFGAGHWSDEARTVYRVCGRRQQNFFFFTLLTAFLGHHTQWLQRLAPEWYRRQHRIHAKQHGGSHTMPQRTVIISDQRAMARRLIFLLASFLPGAPGLDGLQKPGEDMSGSHLSMSSPSSHIIRNESLRRAASRRMREYRLNSTSNDKTLLATSVDSADSMTIMDRPQRLLGRKDSDVLSMKGPPLLPMAEGESNRKVSMATTSAINSHPSTPIAVFSTQRPPDSDGYFPPFADNQESVATAGLTDILRRSSSSLGNSSTMSSRWGSLVSGLSEIWAPKNHESGDPGSPTNRFSTAGSGHQRRTDPGPKSGKTSTLQDMVDQLEENHPTLSKPSKTQILNHASIPSNESTSPIRHVASPPRLRVDDRDGVVDVDLDLPGFVRLDPDDLFKSPTKSVSRSIAAGGRDTAESIRSLRSLPPIPAAAQATLETNVAGYLKRHHEDFCLHAVRPYTDLEEDVKRCMMAEPLPSTLHGEYPARPEETWTPVCTTVIADMRSFSVRKLTLKRKMRIPRRSSLSHSEVNPSHTDTSRTSNATDVQHTFVDEEVKDFDTALADAIEKVLDVGDRAQAPPLLSPRLAHSRTASSSAIQSTPPNTTGFSGSSYTSGREYVRQDCRHVILGALEDIAKDICNDLNKLEQGRDIQGSSAFEASSIKEEMKQENILREGVKYWLLNLEQTRGY